MTAAELIAASRRWLNDENSQTYKWTVAELVDYYNAAMDEVARETDYFTDPSTVAATTIAITAGTPDYAYHATALDILSARLSDSSKNLTRASRGDLNINVPTWRYLNSVYGTDISFATGSIASASTDLNEPGFASDAFVLISGAGESANNKAIKLSAVAENLLTLASGYTLTTEAAGQAVVLQELDTGTPDYYLTDYRTGYITLYPAPDANGTLHVDITRLQSTLLTEATVSSLAIPLHYQYHLGLVNGILYYAYLKSGPSTFNIEKSNVHRGNFAMLKDRIKKDMIKMRGASTIIAPHFGNT